MTELEFTDSLRSLGLTKPFYDVFVGPGWRPLVLELIKKLVDMGWDKDLHQVKQKFGGLRFYIGHGTDEMYNLISDYETRSYAICEECGGVGERHTKGGWISTLCSSCARKS